MRDKRFEVVLSEKDPELLIVTPLRKKDKINRECEQSILKGQSQIRKVWVTFKSKNSASFNRIEGYKKSKSFLRKNLPPYLLFCDNDIEWFPGAFLQMINVLRQTEDNIGYCYCGFRYIGHRNIQFPPKPFDGEFLKRMNYISTMSIHKTETFKQYGKLDLNLQRYQDWDMWLNYLINHQIEGISAGFEGFYAHNTDRDISMKPDKEYRHLKLVVKKYNLPIDFGEEK